MIPESMNARIDLAHRNEKADAVNVGNLKIVEQANVYEAKSLCHKCNTSPHSCQAPWMIPPVLQAQDQGDDPK